MMAIMMKPNIPGPFLLLLLLILLLSSPVHGQGSVLVQTYAPFVECYTWGEAQTFCRSYFTDLTLISKQSDADRLYLHPYTAWIGLHKTSIGTDWTWTNGQHLDYSNWGLNYVPVLTDVCAYIAFVDKKFYATNCGAYNFFICYHLENNIPKYTFISQPMTWSDALQYCRNVYSDLAFFQDNTTLASAVSQKNFPVWIGLYKDGQTWKWSSGSSEYTNWAANEPGNNGDCVAIYSLNKTMMTVNCSARLPFTCFRDNLLLVKEKMTWEKALKYCQTLMSTNNSPYRLVSVQPGDEYSYMKNKAMEANTDEVWTGLRFLAGSWMWVNGAAMSFSDLPICPLSGLYCGAFSKSDTGSFETRDCLEEKNFLCYTKS